MSTDSYDFNVFVNCPFDNEYFPLRSALVFAIFDCGFVPRCALEEDDGGYVRLDKILDIILESKYGIHDISRVEVDSATGFPRFNMAFELGLFIGACRFGSKNDRMKKSLILDSERYRYRAFISDIAGCDIHEHNNQIEEVIRQTRNWLSSSDPGNRRPGGNRMLKRYETFSGDLPSVCEGLGIDIDELTYNDYCGIVSDWLRSH